MPRLLIWTGVLAVLLATFLGYLCHAPHSEEMDQSNRVRVLAAPMKLAHLIGRVVEWLGVSDRIQVLRKVASLATMLQNKKIVDANLRIVDTFIESVPVRIARPVNDAGDLPLIVYFHGGAFYLGSVETYNALTSTLSRSANAVVVSVDYRLAPEHPFPAGLNDCYAVAKYILEFNESKHIRFDPTRVVIAGDSAGGNLAAIVTMRLMTQPVSQYSPRLQVLIYPSLQSLDLRLPSYLQDHFVFLHYTSYHKLAVYLNETIGEALYANKHLSAQQKRQYRKYVDWSLIPAEYRTVYSQPTTDDEEGDPALIDRAKLSLHPDISPLLVEDEQLAKLPMTYMATVGHDRLRDEGFIYAGRLRRIGGKVVHNHYERTFHGSVTFLYGSLGLKIAQQMVDDIVQYLKTHL